MADKVSDSLANRYVRSHDKEVITGPHGCFHIGPISSLRSPYPGLGQLSEGGRISSCLPALKNRHYILQAPVQGVVRRESTQGNLGRRLSYFFLDRDTYHSIFAIKVRVLKQVRLLTETYRTGIQKTANSRRP